MIVIWDPRTIDQRTGEAIWIGAAAGLASYVGTDQTYEAQIIESVWYGHRNVFKHEWGHSILFYFEAAGTSPLPTVTNHALPGQYVHCPTGEPYVWADESEASPIPNSIYNNASGFTHDYYSGTVATPDQPTSCLGITREVWAAGGPVGNSAYYPYYHQIELSPTSTEQTGEPGTTVHYPLTLTNTGNITDSITLTLGSHSWTTQTPTKLRNLGPGASAQFTVDVEIPDLAPAGASDIVTLQASSDGGAAAVEVRLVTRTPARAPDYVVNLPMLRM